MLRAEVQRRLQRMITNCFDCCVTSLWIVNTWLDIKRIHICLCVNDEMCVSQGFQGFGFGDGGFQMSFGIGAFPFGIFATAFNINDGRPPPGIYVLDTSP